MKKSIFTIFVSLFLLGCTHTELQPLPTVKEVELERYLGKWIEIARYENRFEIGCAGATAKYTKEQDFIEVTNSCFDENAKQTGQAKGRAYPTDKTNSKLEVSFFRPFYGDYWILMLGDDYQYSVVGDPQRKYLWILSRTKKLTPNDKEKILQELPKFGYDTDKLFWTSVQP